MARFDLTDAEWTIIAPFCRELRAGRMAGPGRMIARLSTASSLCCVPALP